MAKIMRKLLAIARAMCVSEFTVPVMATGTSEESGETQETTIEDISEKTLKVKKKNLLVKILLQRSLLRLKELWKIPM